MTISTEPINATAGQAETWSQNCWALAGPVRFPWLDDADRFVATTATFLR